MALPKRKVSKRRIRQRHASSNHKIEVMGAKPCPNCGAPQQPHRVCPSCGNYRGRQVLTMEAD